MAKTPPDLFGGSRQSQTPLPAEDSGVFSVYKMVDSHEALIEWLNDTAKCVDFITTTPASEWDSAWGDREVCMGDASQIISLRSMLNVCVSREEHFRAMAICVRIGTVLQRLPLRALEQTFQKKTNSDQGAKKAADRNRTEAEKRAAEFQAFVDAEIESQIATGSQPNFEAAITAVSELLEKRGIRGASTRNLKRVVTNRWTSKAK